MSIRQNPVAGTGISATATDSIFPGAPSSSRRAKGVRACMRIGMAASVLLAASAAQAAPAHEHGVAQLMVAVEGDTVAVELESPLDNLVGFEHAPRTPEQRRAIEAMKDSFRTPATLFVPTPAAGCSAAPAELELPEDLHADGHADGHDEDHGHEHDHAGGHADLHATISFRCKSPAALKEFTVRLFDVFPRLQRIRAQLAVPGRQSAAELDRQHSRLTW